MTKTEQDIKDQLLHLSKGHGPAAILPAIVIAVNDDDTIAVQFSDDSEIDDVRLKSVVKDGNKFLLIPKVQSVVQVGRIENSDELVVVAVEEITEMILVIDTVKIKVDNEGFLFEKGNETVKKLFDDLIAAIKAITVPTNVGPSGTPINAAVFDSIKNRIDNFFK